MFDYWRDLLRRRFAGRKTILARGVLAGRGADVQLLADLGTPPPFILADGVGTGDPPEPGTATWHVLDLPRSELMTSIRRYEAVLADLPADAVAALDAYDPDRRALVIRTLFGTNRTVAGREVYGAREPAWIAYEDKLRVDAVWDRLGIARAPSANVDATAESLRDADAELDLGQGTVWSGDNKEGWHGAAAYVRWVRDETTRTEAIEFFEQHCDRVRVAPFLDGLPCSIHGIVLPDYVIALRPVEMVVLRNRNSAEFRYGGCATFWDPAPADREEMREAAKRTGKWLRETIGYRGAFTIDGIMTADGFRPTELNPRFGAGLLAIHRAIEGLPLYYLDLAIIAREDWDFRPKELEAAILEAADQHRGGGGHTLGTATRTETTTTDLVRVGESYRPAAEGETPDAQIMLGPGATGSFLRFIPDADRTEKGPAMSPWMIRALELADRELGTEFGELEAAPVVR